MHVWSEWERERRERGGGGGGESERVYTCVQSLVWQRGDKMRRPWFLRHFFSSAEIQPLCDYNRICVMKSSTNLNVVSTQSALWKWTMTDKHWAINMLCTVTAAGRRSLHGYFFMSHRKVFAMCLCVGSELWKDSSRHSLVHSRVCQCAVTSLVGGARQSTYLTTVEVIRGRSTRWDSWEGSKTLQQISVLQTIHSMINRWDKSVCNQCLFITKHYVVVTFNPTYTE